MRDWTQPIPCVGGPKHGEWFAHDRHEFLCMVGSMPMAAFDSDPFVHHTRKRTWPERIFSQHPLTPTETIDIPKPFDMPTVTCRYRRVRFVGHHGFPGCAPDIREFWVVEGMSDEKCKEMIGDSRELSGYLRYGKQPARLP